MRFNIISVINNQTDKVNLKFNFLLFKVKFVTVNLAHPKILTLSMLSLRKEGKICKPGATKYKTYKDEDMMKAIEKKSSAKELPKDVGSIVQH